MKKICNLSNITNMARNELLMRCKHLVFWLVSGCLVMSLASAGELQLKHEVTIKLPINARTLAWHPDSITLAAGGWSGMLTVWDTKTGKLIRDLKQPDNAQSGEIQYSKDGKFLAIGKSIPGKGQAYLSLFDSSSFQVIDKLESPRMLEGKNASLESLSIDPTTSKRIVLSSYQTAPTYANDPVIFTTGEAQKKLIRTFPESRSTAQKVSFSPTGKIVAVGRLNSEIGFYSADNGQLVNSFSAFDNIWWIEDLLFSPDGKFIFAASNTGMGREWLDRSTGKWIVKKNNEPIKMWDVQALNLVRTFDTQDKRVQSLAITSDGRFLFAGLTKGYVDIWDVNTGALVKRFQPSKNSTILKMSPDGKHLATSDTGTTEIKIWAITE